MIFGKYATFPLLLIMSTLMNTFALVKTVVVTGAAGGMGRQICAHLAAQGWQVLAIDHNAERLQDLTQRSGIRSLHIDLRASDLCEQVLAQLDTCAPLWGVINLAGASIGAPIEQLTEDDWDLSFAVNVRPAFLLIQALATRLRQGGGGSIINVGSPVGLIGARKPSYAASKAALQGLTMSCARNLGVDQIRVNLLLPGPTITEMTKDWSAERCESIAQGSFLKRLCQPQEIAEVIEFLLSPASRYVTGIVDMTAGSMYGH
jgi:NAD(P)-dependent dehydrogenase (short-subunit alcohol dehydrogenase family)